jgi:hypothetical protein
MKYKGITSAALIYDNKPISDHFRKVNDTMVAGVMDAPTMNHGGLYYFYLIRI